MNVDGSKSFGSWSNIGIKYGSFSILSMRSLSLPSTRTVLAASNDKILIFSWQTCNLDTISFSIEFHKIKIRYCINLFFFLIPK